MSLGATGQSTTFVPFVGSVSGLAGGVVVDYDDDAQDYFTRVEGLGGSINVARKQFISDFVAGLKADSLWTKMTEMYLMCCTDFAGITAKLKYDTVATLTNHNFVSGDFIQIGAGSGLIGNGSSKYLDTGLVDNTLTALSKSFGVYVTESTSSASVGGLIGAQTFNWESTIRFDNPAWSIFAEASGDGDLNVSGLSPADGLLVATIRGVNDSELYREAVSIATDTVIPSASNSSQNWFMFAKNSGGSPSAYTNSRMTFGFIGDGLTDAENTSLSTRVTTLMSAIGTEV